MRPTVWVVLVAIAAITAFALGTRFASQPSQSDRPLIRPAESIPSDPARVVPVASTSQQGPTSIAEVAAVSSEFERARLAFEFAAAANETTLQQYFLDVQDISDLPSRTALSDVILMRYVEVNADGAITFLLSESFQLRPTLINRAFFHWAKFDLEAAIAAAIGLTQSPEDQAAKTGILQANSAQGPERLAAIDARFQAAPSAEVSPNSVIRLSNTDPQTAIIQAEELPPDIGARVAVTIGQSWGGRDPEAALLHARSLDGDRLHAPLMDGLFSVWITTNPSRVIEILDSGVSSDERAYIVRSGTNRMARAMPREAFELIQGMSDPIARDEAARDALQLWAQQDPAAAGAALETFETRDRDALGMAVGHQYARADPERALEWAIGFDGGQGETWRNTLSEIARREPERSFQLAAATPESDRGRAYTISVSSMAQIDTDVATQYWQRLPDDVKPDGAWYVVLEWVKRDTNAAADWLLGLPGGAARDRGLDALLNEGTIENRDYARLLNAISVPIQRDARSSRVLRSMIAEGDLQAAETLLSQLELSQQAYDSARNRIDSAR